MLNVLYYRTHYRIQMNISNLLIWNKQSKIILGWIPNPQD